MRKKKFAILGILFCMVVCLLATRLWGGGCPAAAATPGEILSEYLHHRHLDHVFSTFPIVHDISTFPIVDDISTSPIFYDDTYLLFASPYLSETPKSGKKGPAAICNLPDTFQDTKKSPLLIDGKPSKHSDEDGDWYWGIDGHLYPWPPPEPAVPQPEVTRHPDGKVTTKHPDDKIEIKEVDTPILIDDSLQFGMDSFQPFVLETGPVSPTVEKALEKFDKAWSELREKLREMKEAEKRAKRAAEKLGQALNDAMDAEPGSEEAKEAAEDVKEAAKEAEEAGQEEERARKESDEATRKKYKALREWREAYEKATEPAEKQNKAAGEAAEKAYEATGHGKPNKK